MIFRYKKSHTAQLKACTAFRYIFNWASQLQTVSNISMYQSVGKLIQIFDGMETIQIYVESLEV